MEGSPLFPQVEKGEIVVYQPDGEFYDVAVFGRTAGEQVIVK